MEAEVAVGALIDRAFEAVDAAEEFGSVQQGSQGTWEEEATAESVAASVAHDRSTFAAFVDAAFTGGASTSAVGATFLDGRQDAGARFDGDRTFFDDLTLFGHRVESPFSFGEKRLVSKGRFWSHNRGVHVL